MVQTQGYVLRDMTDNIGAFYSAEGAFYLWQEFDIRKLLAQDADIFIFYYGVMDKMYDQLSHTLKHRYRDGEAGIGGQLAD